MSPGEELQPAAGDKVEPDVSNGLGSRAPTPDGTSGSTRRGWVWFLRVLCVASIGLFLWSVGRFYQPRTGFSSLISIGDASNPEVTALQRVPHFVYEDSAGYDGAYYVQLALNPTLANPELKKSIDNLPYRARRMLFCWVAWALGLGQPAWIVQVHALLNVGCWLMLAVLLWGWLPPTTGQDFFRWAGVMFSHGVCMSVRDSLVDLPALLLVALALREVERGRHGRGGVILALAGLGKETSLLAGAGLANPHGSYERERVEGRPLAHARSYFRTVGMMLLIALPLLVWMGFLRWKFGPADDPGLGNFTWPFVGLAEKWGTVMSEFWLHPNSIIFRSTLAAAVAITVQFLFFALRWRRQELWWRVGAAFALMMIFLATPVWEGYPGAFTRVLLPMTLAFNLLVPRTRAWLPILVAGNLGIFAGLQEAVPPPREFAWVGGAGAEAAQLHLGKPGPGWYATENVGDRRWRWSRGEAELTLHNDSGHPLAATIQAEAAAANDTRSLRIISLNTVLWTGEIGRELIPIRFAHVFPPGETVLRFTTDLPPHAVGADRRALAFQITNFEVVVPPSARQP